VIFGDSGFLNRRMPKRKKNYPWRVTRLKATPAILVGVVYAPDEEAARKAAIEQFQI